ncbi:MAG: two-component sensor histidine kinase [Spirochaetaceae bacterium]|jgi:signal transduction histidine kinase|nr:two-component sensor histidine kinase [Spirochaetaceae bacterium]
MKDRFTIRLQNRLALTYTVFISGALAALAVAINLFTALSFNALIKENINRKSEEIVRVIEGLYSPMRSRFERLSVEAIGMSFVHEGYIVSVHDAKGNSVWNARSCNMQQCFEAINSIAFRMEGQFRLKGELQKQVYPVYYDGKSIGAVTIETYGPFFYSETETRFLRSINRLLLVAGLILALLSAGIALIISKSIAEPILKAAQAARAIATVHSDGTKLQRFRIRIPDEYKTRELQDLSRSINGLAFELEEGERRQKQLSTDIAHELRTPLTCLQGNVEAMIDGVYEPDKEHLLSCHEEILRLIRLVEDLDTLTGFEWDRVKLNKTTFDLAKLVQVTAEQFGAALYEKGITLDLNLRESPIEADYDRLKQVFMNLFSNALKYTDSGTIKVCIEKGVHQWDTIISDSGMGIPESEIPYIFERFYRTDKSRSRSTGGSGIGLAIAAAIVSAHGGTIHVESVGAENGSNGAIFRVAL